MNLKYIIFILLIITSFITIKLYKEVWHDKKSWLFGLITYDAGFAPTKWWFISLFITLCLVAVGWTLAETEPIIINF